MFHHDNNRDSWHDFQTDLSTFLYNYVRICLVFNKDNNNDDYDKDHEEEEKED